MNILLWILRFNRSRRLLRRCLKWCGGWGRGIRSRDDLGPKWWGFYLHGPGLAASGLAIGEDGSIESSDDRTDDWNSNFFINVYLVGAGSKDTIECKTVLVFLNLRWKEWYIDGDIFVGKGDALLSLVGDFYLVEWTQAAYHADWVLRHPLV